MLWTWQNGDIGRRRASTATTSRRCGRSRPRLIAMPAEKDLYFPPEDEEWAASYIPNGEVRVIPGVWGHFAGSGASPVDTAYIDAGGA